jgi:predicted nucleic acid-binding protein
MIVLDTNVLSELMRPEPAKSVLRWFASQNNVALFTTTVTQAEILFGLALLPNGRRREGLLAVGQKMFEEDFDGRVLPFDASAAQEFALIAANRRVIGCPIETFDAQIAAIARSRRAAVATRNVADFQGCELIIIDPWT